MFLGGTGSDNALSYLLYISDIMDALEAVRLSMFTDVTVSAVENSGCLLQTWYGSKLFDVLEEFADY